MRHQLKAFRRAFTDEGRLEAAARTAHKMLDARDKNILVASFDTPDAQDEYLFVFARGDRARQARAVLENVFPLT